MTCMFQMNVMVSISESNANLHNSYEIYWHENRFNKRCIFNCNVKIESRNLLKSNENDAMKDENLKQ